MCKNLICQENITELIVSGEEIKNHLQNKTVCDWGFYKCFEPDERFNFSNARQPVFNKNFNLLGENMQEYQQKGYEVFILS